MHHIKNNKSNLMINVSEVPSSNSNIAQSLSLKRLKTPKLKIKEELGSPPVEHMSHSIH